MKLVLLISVALLKFNLAFSQPISTPSIRIENTFIKNKITCLGSQDGINYTLSIKRKCKDCIKKSFSVRVNKYYILIHKKDTMRLKLLFDSHSIFRFQIDTLFFQKGDFIIDLKGCQEAKVKTNSAGYILTINGKPTVLKRDDFKNKTMKKVLGIVNECIKEGIKGL